MVAYRVLKYFELTFHSHKAEYLYISVTYILISLFGFGFNITVTKLREHWDETNSKVMQRKTQLDMMLGDSQRYEAKRNEVEVWLARMETRLERMRAVGHTADVLEAQLREQKVRRTLFFLVFARITALALLGGEFLVPRVRSIFSG